MIVFALGAVFGVTAIVLLAYLGDEYDKKKVWKH